MSSFAIALTIAYEDYSMVTRCLTMAKRAYGESLTNILVVDNGCQFLDELREQFGVTVLENTNKQLPIFMRHQMMIEYFLDKTAATHYIKIDPDTIVLRWDGEFPEVAGQFARYGKEHQKARWQAMPKVWQKTYRDFILKGAIHSVNGGYMLFSREACKAMRSMFYKEQHDWNLKTLRVGWQKETKDGVHIIGEEHMLGYLLGKAKIKTGYTDSVDQEKLKYYTYKGNVDKIKRPKQLNVFHPVKTRKTYDALLEKVGVVDEAPQLEKRLAVAMVVSYESRDLVERALLLALRAYGKNVHDIVLVSKKFEHCDYFAKKYNAQIVQCRQTNVPYFLAYEQLYQYVLNETIATHVVSFDADTVIVDWDGEFPNLAGMRISYVAKHQRLVFEQLSKQWRRKHGRFVNVGCIHALHGSWVWLSRETIKEMAPHFFLEEVEWPSQEVNYAEEQILGYYLRLARRAQGLNSSLKDVEGIVDGKLGRYVLTNRVKWKSLDQLQVRHPVKTDEEFDDLLTSIKQEKAEAIKRYLSEHL